MPIRIHYYSSPRGIQQLNRLHHVQRLNFFLRNPTSIPTKSRILSLLQPFFVRSFPLSRQTNKHYSTSTAYTTSRLASIVYRSLPYSSSRVISLGGGIFSSSSFFSPISSFDIRYRNSRTSSPLSSPSFFIYRTMKVHIEVVGLNTGDAAPSIMVVTDSVRYLFNVGEGLQRFCSEHRLRVVRTDSIFLTGTVNTLNVGGLPGLLLTIADMGKKSMNIYGNYGIHAYISALRNFMRRDDVSVYCGEFTLPSSSTVRTLISSTISPSAIRLPSIRRPELTVTPIMLISNKTYTTTQQQPPPPSIDAVSNNEVKESKECIHNYVRNTFGSFSSLSRSHHSQQQSQKSSSISSRSLSPLSRSVVTENESSVSLGGPLQHNLTFNPLTIESLSTAPVSTETHSSIHNILNDYSKVIDPTITALCYVCTTDTIIGKFYPEKAKALGVPLGPLFGILKNGQSIEIDDAMIMESYSSKGPKNNKNKGPGTTNLTTVAVNLPTVSMNTDDTSTTSEPKSGSTTTNTKRIIEPSQVKDPDLPGQVFAIIACPSKDFLPSLLNSYEALQPFLPTTSSSVVPSTTATSVVESTIKVMYHMTPADIATTPEYITWLNSLDSSIQHIMLDPLLKNESGKAMNTNHSIQHHTTVPTMFYSQAMQQCKLHILRPSTFALPVPVNDTVQYMYQQLLANNRAFYQYQLHHKQTNHSLSPLQRILQFILSTTASLPNNNNDGMNNTNDIHPINSQFSTVVSSLQSPRSIETIQLGNRTVQNGWPLQRFTVLPTAAQGIDTDANLPILQPLEALQEMVQDSVMLPHIQQAFQTSGNSASESLSTTTASSSSLVTSSTMPSDVEIIFTGTSSALPNKYRNVSGIYVYMPTPTGSPSHSFARSGIFLDCGEGSYGGLVRRFGRTAASGTEDNNINYLPKSSVPSSSSSISTVDEAMSVLKILWISHMHADHHLGALRLIYERSQIRQRLNLPTVPLLIIGPTRMYTWLMEYTNIDPSLLQQWRFVDAEHFLTIPSVIDSHEKSNYDSEDEGNDNNNSNSNANAVVSSLRSDLSGDYPNKLTPNQLLNNLSSGTTDNTKKDSSSNPPPEKVQQLRKKPRINNETLIAVTDNNSTNSVAMDIDGAVCNVPEKEVIFTDNNNVLLREPPRQSRRPTRYIIPFPSLSSFPSNDGTGSSTLSSSSSSTKVSTSVSVMNHLADEKFIDTIVHELGISSLRTVRVRHCMKAYGIRLDMLSNTQHPWSMVYSGDTRPCSELIALGQGMVNPLVQLPFAGPTPLITWYTSLNPTGTMASIVHNCLHQPTNLLIHEATFEDTDEGKINALIKRHTTAGEAVTVGQSMKTNFTLLTHFSARYPKLPVIKVPVVVDTNSTNNLTTTKELSSGMNVFVAYDLMTVHGKDLFTLPSLLPSMHDLFAEEAAKNNDDEEEEEEDDEGEEENKNNKGINKEEKKDKAGTRKEKSSNK